MMKKLLLLAIIMIALVAPPAAAVCPASWNNPNLTCITTANWHDFVNNWTYQNGTIWASLETKSPILNLDGFLFHNGTRILTGPLNAGNLNITNVSEPLVSSDASTKGYVDTQDNYLLSLVNSWISVNNSVTLNSAIVASNANMTLAGNTSFPSSSTDGNLLSFYGSGGHTVLDSGIPNSSPFLVTGARTMTGSANMGGYNVTGVGTPVASSDAVPLTYLNDKIGAWSSFNATPTWPSTEPTISSTVAEYVRNGDLVTFDVTYEISEGNNATSPTLPLPVAPSQVGNRHLSITGFKNITYGDASLMSDPFPYIDYTEATPVIKFSQFGTLPSGYTAELRISGSYEV